MTSLIPVVVFPLLGVMDTSRVCGSYITETIMMFLGGLMVGLAVEYCNLHLRIALRVVLWVGSDLKWYPFFCAITQRSKSTSYIISDDNQIGEIFSWKLSLGHTSGF